MNLGATARTILVLDDEIGVAGSLQQKSFLRHYERLPYTFVFESCLDSGRHDPERAVQVALRETEVALVLLDLYFGPDRTLLGFEILRRLTARLPSLPVLVMSSADRDVAMLGRCLEDGAVGFVEKLRSAEYLRKAIESAVELMQSHVLLGQSPPLKELRRQAARLSPYDQIPVLIVGERGTGKERVARYVHHNGPRRQGPFVAVSCAGVPETLFEAEFFGAEKGAFTGAESLRHGFMERAHGGTLFLDEVGALPLSLQPKLLRALQDHRFTRLGTRGNEVESNFQLISATNTDPLELISSGRLCEDFYDRITAVTIRTPPLRDCLGDVPLLGEHTLRRLVGLRKHLSPAALACLQRYHWPGNVRELQRVIQEAVVRSEDASLIDETHLPEYVVTGSTAPLARLFTHQDVSITDGEDWPRERLLAELRIAVAAKRAIAASKGAQWRAEFMRRVYPHCKAQNAKGLADLVRRLTKGPWGDPYAERDPELAALLRELRS